MTKKSKTKIQFYETIGRDLTKHYHKNNNTKSLRGLKKKYSTHSVSAFMPDKLSEGLGAYECFFAYETHGVTNKCKHAELDTLFDIFTGNQSLNITISDIADSIIEQTFFPVDMITYKDYPYWFKKAFINLAGKRGASDGRLRDFRTILDNDRKYNNEDDIWNLMESRFKEIFNEELIRMVY